MSRLCDRQPFKAALLSCDALYHVLSVSLRRTGQQLFSKRADTLGSDRVHRHHVQHHGLQQRLHQVRPVSGTSDRGRNNLSDVDAVDITVCPYRRCR